MPFGGRRRWALGAALTGTTLLAIIYVMPTWAADVEVQMVEGSATDINSWNFNPTEVTINAGDTVTFHNTGAQQHTATSSTGTFDTGLIPPGESKTVAIAAPGTYAFVCTPHPWMKGTITVNAAAAPAAAPAPAAQPATKPAASPAAAAAPVAKPVAQALPTPTPFRLATSPATGTVAPRAGSLPMELALPLLMGGGAAALAGAGVILRSRRRRE
jgi:plastocyanin